MAEYAFNPAQSVNAGAPVILNTVIPCNKGFVYHREQSGILRAIRSRLTEMSPFLTAVQLVRLCLLQ